MGYTRPPSMGHSIDWLPDGRMLVTGDELFRYEPDGAIVTHAPQGGNEIVVDARGNIYVNGAGFGFAGVEQPNPGDIKLVTPDDRTLVIIESFAGRLTAFSILDDGSLGPAGGHCPSSPAGSRAGDSMMANSVDLSILGSPRDLRRPGWTWQARPMRMRSVISGLLLFLGCVTALAAVPVRWADQQIHSDGYAETIRPLVRSPEVQTAFTNLVLDAATEQTGRELPPQARELAQTQAAAVLGTQAAGDLWVQANLTARDAIVNGSGNQVAVDVNQVADELRGPLQKELQPLGVRIPELPASAGRLVLVDSPVVGQARETIQLVTTLAGILPWLAIGFLAVALAVSPRRGRTLVAAGLGIGIPALIGLLLLVFTGEAAVMAFGDAQTQPFIVALYQAFAASLRSDLLWLVVACGLAVVAGIVLSMVTGRRRNDDESYDAYGEPEPYQPYQPYPPPPYHQQPYPPQPQQQQQPYGQQPYPGQQPSRQQPQQPRY